MPRRGLVMLAALGLLVADPARAGDSGQRTPQKHVLSGVICGSEAALDAAFTIMDRIQPAHYRRFNSYEIDRAALDEMAPDGCATATVKGFVRVMGSQAMQGESVRIFEVRSAVEYWDEPGARSGVSYSGLSSR